MKLREIKPGMVIHCKTMKEADALCDNLGASSQWKEHWDICKEKTCYEIDKDGSLCCSGLMRSFVGKEIIEFSDLIIPELTPAEVLKICNEICKTVGSCENCMMDCNCYAVRGSDYQEIVEICEQWKVDHEKKEPDKIEPEVEWFWQGCINKVLDSGMVTQLTEGKGIYDTGCKYQASAEEYMADILKEFCKEHEGNFIATVEHVCRIKK